MLDLKRIYAGRFREPEDTTLKTVYTPWGETLDPENVLPEHPRPQFARDAITMLNGLWDYAFVNADDADAIESVVGEGSFEGKILVPFSPETPLSRVGRQLQPNELLIYHRTFETPDMPEEGHCLLHFEAVDYECDCYVNGQPVGSHVGGYLPFTFDITAVLRPGQNEILLTVYDPSDTYVQLRGKQVLKRGGIWYTAQSGIYHPVWLEVVPRDYIKSMHINPDARTNQLEIQVDVTGTETLGVHVKDAEGKVIASAELNVEEDAKEEDLGLSIPIPDPRLWSPEDPYLYDLEITYGDDRVTSYCAFRTVSVEKASDGHVRFFLNGKPYFIRGLLDQGYWSDGFLTAPADEAMVHDITEMKKLGFNMLRKHIKVESDRWYYHCDRLGMLVWQDMVSGGGPYEFQYVNYLPTLLRWSWTHFPDDTPAQYRKMGAGNEAYRDEWREACVGTIKHLRNHPSIVTWVLFNESWGQFEAKKATALAHATDPTRLLDSTSGWYDQRCGNYFSVHNYFREMTVWPEPKPITPPGRAFVISEFGGFSYFLPEHSVLDKSYGYGGYSDLSDWQNAVRDLLYTVGSLEAKGLAGYVYTQVSDVEEETNGILTYDRRVNKLTASA